MGRRSWLGALLAATMMIAPGCESKSGGSITKEQAEKDIAERLSYTEVTLNDVGAGKFTGTAKDDRGDIANVEVTYQGNTVSWSSSYKSGDGRVSRQSSGSAAR